LNTTAALDTGSDDFGQLATDRAGNWIVVWMSRDSLGSTIGTDYDILGARSTDNGASWSDPELVNLNGDADGALDRFPAILTDGSGQWIAGWYSTDSLGGTIGSDYDMLFTRWSLALCDDADADLDGFTGCGGDCDDTDPDVYPAAQEICDGIDNQCPGDLGHGETDEGFADADTDGVADCIDNCDGDPNVGQEDADSDGLGDVCDACPLDADNDLDSDGLCADADNCPADANPDQSDLDDDQEGDWCDLDDGMILVYHHDNESVNWQEESGYAVWNCYRGDLDVLRTEGLYTQLPWDSDLAGRHCGLTANSVPDVIDLPAGATVFYLVTGEIDGIEDSLGFNSDGVERTNDAPCP
jgi:hypothetical protein